MANAKQKLGQFLGTRVGLLLLFAVIFYVMTFAVYYFYSPGPEERKQTEISNSNL